jgi:MFS family permease
MAGEHRPAVGTTTPLDPAGLEGARSVLRNDRFLALFLSQLLTQVGGNMVLFGLTVQVYRLTQSSTSVSILLLTFLVPAVIFGAVAGVYVDRIERRRILIVTNVLRAAAFVALIFVDNNLVLLYLLTIVVATMTTFFAPAEAAMIPIVVERRQLLAANGIFVFTLQASFVLGFALLGPLLNNLTGTRVLILTVAVFYAAAAVLCWTLPPSRPRTTPPDPAQALGEAERAVVATFSQLGEGLSYIRANRSIFWALTYLAITASLVGVLGVLGPDFAVRALGLTEADFVIVVLPLGAGLVLGILVLSVYGRFVRRRRIIEGGLIGLAVALAILGLAQRAERDLNLGPLVSLLTIVVVVAFAMGVAYAFVAVPAQTELQEELPPDVRGRVFGVLNMLVSVASFLPIIIVGPVADLVGTPAVILGSAVVVAATGVGSILKAHPADDGMFDQRRRLAPVDPIAVTTSSPLTGPVRLDMVEWPDGEPEPQADLATPVVPGRAGPAPHAEPRAPSNEAGDTGRTEGP